MNNAGSANHTGHDDTTHNAALRGAVLAFQKTPTNRAPTPTSISTSTPTTTSTSNRDTTNGRSSGALLAATTATSASRDHGTTTHSLAHSPSQSRQNTGAAPSISLGRDHSVPSQRPVLQNAHSATGQNNLLTPARSTTGDPRSPSLIAATLAASRSASPSPKLGPSAQMPSRTIAERPKTNASGDGPNTSIVDLDLATDLSPIGPANTLISLFEQKQNGTDPIKKSPAVSSAKRGPKPGLQPITPPRVMSPVVTSDASPSRSTPSLAWGKPIPPSPVRDHDMAGSKSPLGATEGTGLQVSPSLNAVKKSRPIPPPSRVISRANTTDTLPKARQTPPKLVTNTLVMDSSSGIPSSVPSTVQTQPNIISKSKRPITSPIREKGLGAFIRRSSSSLSNDTFVSASSAPSPQQDSSRRKSSRPTVPKASQPPRPLSANMAAISPALRSPISQSPSQIPLDSLTNAIVAGSLASARATPSRSKPPTPPPRKQTPHMRQTLRIPRSKSDETVPVIGSQHKRKPLGKLSSRKKHAHHEGARKRWREEITGLERQRYEGLWASNRGYLLDDGSLSANGLRNVDTSQLVANVVVRDIWARSRLPFDELAEVWDLVDDQGKGALDKAQFVVGMWLVDQRLRGRKIPRKVSDSVWGSAKGVRVSGPKVKR